MGTQVLCYNKEHPIFTCEIEKNAVITKTMEVLDEKHLPISLQDGNFNLESVNTWLQLRKIPEKREDLEMARKKFRGFEHYHNMFSLSDQYWFQYSQKENWKNLNFFTNEYQNETGKIFFTPWDVDTDKLKKESPDLTTNGILKKRWVQQQNGISYLIKAGSRTYNQNPISEVLTTMFLKMLNIIPFVEYELVVDSLKICSKCRNFIDADTEFVPATQIYNKIERNKAKGETVYDHIVKMSVKYGLNEEEVKKYLDSMIAADTILQNSDRHLNNFGYIRDVESGRILGFAPLFDSGTAFSASKKHKAMDMFLSRQKTALKKTFDKLELEDFDEGPMLQMVAAFPQIPVEEKKIIREKIKHSAEMIRQGGIKIDAIEKEEEDRWV